MSPCCRKVTRFEHRKHRTATMNSNIAFFFALLVVAGLVFVSLPSADAQWGWGYGRGYGGWGRGLGYGGWGRGYGLGYYGRGFGGWGRGYGGYGRGWYG